MFKKYHTVLLLLSMIYCPNLYSQDDIIEHQIWVDIIPHFEINNSMEYYGDMSYRTSTIGDTYNRFVLKPTVRYHWNDKFDLIGGIGFFYTQETDDYRTVELRPYQGVRLSWPSLWRMNFRHRCILEERLLWNNGGDFNPAIRFRYRIKTKLPINKSSVQYKTVYIPLSYEAFANGGGEDVEIFQNRARAMTGLGYVYSDKWIAEFEVTFQRSRSSKTGNLKLSDRIFRLKLTYDGWIFGE